MKIVLLAGTMLVTSQIVFAQSATDYPSKLVRIIVAAGSGGGADVIGRIFTQKLTEHLKGQSIVKSGPPSTLTVL